MRRIDVLTAQEDGTTALNDEALLDRAGELGRVLVSQDDDPLREGTRRLRDSLGFAGVIYAHQLRSTIGQMVQDLELIARATLAEEWRDRIEFLPLG
jgi:hypothetical protein